MKTQPIYYYVSKCAETGRRIFVATPNFFVARLRTLHHSKRVWKTVGKNYFEL